MLSELRKKHGYTQTQLADLLGIHQVELSRYETGRVTPNKHFPYHLAYRLGIKPEKVITSLA